MSGITYFALAHVSGSFVILAHVSGRSLRYSGMLAHVSRAVRSFYFPTHEYLASFSLCREVGDRASVRLGGIVSSDGRQGICAEQGKRPDHNHEGLQSASGGLSILGLDGRDQLLVPSW